MSTTINQIKNCRHCTKVGKSPNNSTTTIDCSKFKVPVDLLICTLCGDYKLEADKSYVFRRINT